MDDWKDDEDVPGRRHPRDGIKKDCILPAIARPQMGTRHNTKMEQNGQSEPRPCEISPRRKKRARKVEPHKKKHICHLFGGPPPKPERRHPPDVFLLPGRPGKHGIEMWNMPKRFNPNQKKKTDAKQSSVANAGNRVPQGRDQPQICPHEKPPWQLRRRLSPIPPGSKEGPGNSTEKQREIQNRESVTGKSPQMIRDGHSTEREVTDGDKSAKDELVQEPRVTKKENTQEIVDQLITHDASGATGVDREDAPDPDDRDDEPCLEVSDNERSTLYAGEQDEIAAVTESTEKKLKLSHSHADVENFSPVTVIPAERRAKSTPLICEREKICSTKDISDSISDQVMTGFSVCIETDYDFETSYFKKSLCNEEGESDRVLHLVSNCDLSLRPQPYEEVDERELVFSRENTENISHGDNELLKLEGQREEYNDGNPEMMTKGTMTSSPKELTTTPSAEETTVNVAKAKQDVTDSSRAPRFDEAKAPINSFRSNPEINSLPERGRVNLPLSATTIPQPGGQEILFEIPAVPIGSENPQEGLIDESAGDNIALDLSETEISIHTTGQGDQSRVSPGQELSSTLHDNGNVTEIHSARERSTSSVQNIDDESEEPGLGTPQTRGPVSATGPASEAPRPINNLAKDITGSVGDDEDHTERQIDYSCCDIFAVQEECRGSMNILHQSPRRKAAPSTPAADAVSPQLMNEGEVVLATKVANPLSRDFANVESQDPGPPMLQVDAERMPSPQRTTFRQETNSELAAVFVADEKASRLSLVDSSKNLNMESKVSIHTTRQGDERAAVVVTSPTMIVSPQPNRCESVSKLAREGKKLEYPTDTESVTPRCHTSILHESLRTTSPDISTSRNRIKSEDTVSPSLGEENGNGIRMENVENDTDGETLAAKLMPNQVPRDDDLQGVTHNEINTQEPCENDRDVQLEGGSVESSSTSINSESRTTGPKKPSADREVPDVQSLIDSVIVRRLSTEVCKEDDSEADTSEENRDASKTYVVQIDKLQNHDSFHHHFESGGKTNQISTCHSVGRRYKTGHEDVKSLEESARCPVIQRKAKSEAKRNWGEEIKLSGLEEGKTPHLQLLDAFTAMNDAVQAAKLIIRYLGMTDSRLRAALHRAGPCDDRVHKCLAAERIAEEAQAFATRTQSVFMTYYRLAEAEDSFRDMVLAQLHGTERERRKLKKWWTNKESREPDIEEVPETSDEEENQET